MTRRARPGGYFPQAYPWAQVRADNRAERVRERLAVQDVEALVALVRFDLERRGAGPATARTYAVGVRAYLTWCWATGRDVLEPDADVALDFTRHLNARRGVGPGSVLTYRPAVSALYRALRWARATVADPMRDAPRVKDPVPRHEKRRPYSEIEARHLLSVAQGDERLLLLLALLGGLRNAEVRAARWEHVDWAAGLLLVRGKGERVRRVVLARELLEALREASEVASERARRPEYLIPWKHPDTVRWHMQRVCEAAGVSYAGRAFHGARHTSGTLLYRGTRNLDDVARHLGHSQIETSRVYAEHDDSATRDVLDKLKLS